MANVAAFLPTIVDRVYLFGWHECRRSLSPYIDLTYNSLMGIGLLGKNEKFSRDRSSILLIAKGFSDNKLLVSYS